MIGIYLIVAFIISTLLFFNRNRTINYTLIICFLFLQCGFTVYEYLHINIPVLYYFTPDALAILMLITLTIISIPAMYHSYKYISSKNDNPKHTAIYFSAIPNIASYQIK
jgi:hydrogenase-4 component F